jgi:hypothetical protein
LLDQYLQIPCQLGLVARQLVRDTSTEQTRSEKTSSGHVIHVGSCWHADPSPEGMFSCTLGDFQRRLCKTPSQLEFAFDKDLQLSRRPTA